MSTRVFGIESRSEYMVSTNYSYFYHFWGVNDLRLLNKKDLMECKQKLTLFFLLFPSKPVPLFLNGNLRILLPLFGNKLKNPLF